MTIDPEHRPSDGTAGGRGPSKTLVNVLSILAALVVVVVVLAWTSWSDGVDDEEAILQRPADPTEVTDYEAPAVTRPAELPATGGAAPATGDVAAPVGPAPVPPAE